MACDTRAIVQRSFVAAAAITGESKMASTDTDLPIARLRFDKLLVYMSAAYFLTAVGVMMLGPLLPLLSRSWRLADGASGALLSAQFLGSYCGAVLLRRDLRKSLYAGGVCCVAGYGAMAIATHFTGGFPIGVGALLVGGFGIGQLINSISMIAGRRYGDGRGRALMILNLIWSAGALLGPLYVGFATLHVSVPFVLAPFVAAVALLLLWERSTTAQVWINGSRSVTRLEVASPQETQRTDWPLPVYFILVFFLYGAFENSISGWISSFAFRYAHTSAASSALSTTVLWAGITAGRAGGLLLLRVWSERKVQLLSLLVAVVTSGLLFLVTGPAALLILTMAIGCGLAPFVPLTASLFLAAAKPTSRVGGFVLATNALGGACLPWVVGLLSQHFGSLRFALELPTLVGALLLMLCLAPLSKTVASIRNASAAQARG